MVTPGGLNWDTFKSEGGTACHYAGAEAPAGPHGDCRCTQPGESRRKCCSCALTSLGAGGAEAQRAGLCSRAA